MPASPPHRSNRHLSRRHLRKVQEQVLNNDHGQLALAKLWVILRPMLEGFGCQAERGGAACKRERKVSGGMVVSYKINMNTSKPLEHAHSQGGGDFKMFRWEHWL